MNDVAAISIAPDAIAGLGRPGTSGGGPAPAFAAALERAATDADRSAAREAAAALVSTAFVLPALAALRAGAPTDGPLAPGTAERRFGPLLDRHLADRITTAQRLPLVDAVLARFPNLSTPSDPTDQGPVHAADATIAARRDRHA